MAARRVQNPFAAGRGGPSTVSSPRRVQYNDHRYQPHHHRHGRGRGGGVCSLTGWTGVVVMVLLLCIYSFFPSSQPAYSIASNHALAGVQEKHDGATSSVGKQSTPTAAPQAAPIPVPGTTSTPTVTAQMPVPNNDSVDTKNDPPPTEDSGDHDDEDEGMAPSPMASEGLQGSNDDDDDDDQKYSGDQNYGDDDEDDSGDQRNGGNLKYSTDQNDGVDDEDDSGDHSDITDHNDITDQNEGGDQNEGDDQNDVTGNNEGEDQEDDKNEGGGKNDGDSQDNKDYDGEDDSRQLPPSAEDDEPEHAASGTNHSTAVDAPDEAPKTPASMDEGENVTGQPTMDTTPVQNSSKLSSILQSSSTTLPSGEHRNVTLSGESQTTVATVGFPSSDTNSTLNAPTTTTMSETGGTATNTTEIVTTNATFMAGITTSDSSITSLETSQLTVIGNASMSKLDNIVDTDTTMQVIHVLAPMSNASAEETKDNTTVASTQNKVHALANKAVSEMATKKKLNADAASGNQTIPNQSQINVITIPHNDTQNIAIVPTKHEPDSVSELQNNTNTKNPPRNGESVATLSTAVNNTTHSWNETNGTNISTVNGTMADPNASKKKRKGKDPPIKITVDGDTDAISSVTPAATSFSASTTKSMTNVSVTKQESSAATESKQNNQGESNQGNQNNQGKKQLRGANSTQTA